MSARAVSRHNRDHQVMAESHPDCMACTLERINAERRAIAAGALRLEVLDLRALIRQLGGASALAEYDRTRSEVDHIHAPCCEHGRALYAACRRCNRGANRED